MKPRFEHDCGLCQFVGTTMVALEKVFGIPHVLGVMQDRYGVGLWCQLTPKQLQQFFDYWEELLGKTEKIEWKEDGFGGLVRECPYLGDNVKVNSLSCQECRYYAGSSHGLVDTTSHYVSGRIVSIYGGHVWCRCKALSPLVPERTSEDFWEIFEKCLDIHNRINNYDSLEVSNEN